MLLESAHNVFGYRWNPVDSVFWMSMIRFLNSFVVAVDQTDATDLTTLPWSPR